MPSEISHKKTDESKLTRWKLVKYASIAGGAIVIVCILLLFLFPDIYLNRYFKARIIKDFTSGYPGYSMRISDLHFNVLKNRIDLDSIKINSSDSTLLCSINKSSLSGIGWLQLIWNGNLVPDALAGSVAESQGIVLKLPKSQNKFRCKQLRVSLHDSEFVVNNLEIHPLTDDNQFFEESEYRKTRFSMNLPHLKISGLNFIGLLQDNIYHARFIQIHDATLDFLVNLNKPVQPDTLNNIIQKDIIASIKEKIVIDSLSVINCNIKYGESKLEGSKPVNGFALHCGELNVSTSDSELVANDLEIHPLVDDNQFFDESEIRKTRFRFELPHLRVSGLDCPGLLQGKMYKARFIQIRDASLDILVSMYKPYVRDSIKFLMPNEMVSSMKSIMDIDSLIVINGQLRYGEIYRVPRSKPAVVTFDDVHLLAEGISNNNKRGDTLAIHANAIFMGAGRMIAILHVPLTSPDFSFHYSGSLSTMNLNRLNTFIEIAENKRIKSGIVQAASFNIYVKNGHATGNVRAVYNDLILALLDSRTKSEKGIMDRIKSFLANTFKLHGTNEKDDEGVLKLGKVKHSRTRDDTFIQYSWFALRSGVADIIGF